MNSPTATKSKVITAKMFAAVLAMLTALMLTVVLSGCSSTSEGEQEAANGNQTQNSQSSQPQIAYEDIAWTVDTTIIDGERQVGMTYTNNSDYKIIDLQMQFAAKPDLTPEQLTAFDSLDQMESPSDTFLENGLDCDISVTVEAGATSPSRQLSLSIWYIDSMEQYELSEPDIMSITFVDKDNKVYLEHIDCKNGSITTEPDIIDGNQWPEGQLSDRLPKPEGMIILQTSSSDAVCGFTAKDVTTEEANAYIEACKSAGYTSDSMSSESNYRATTDDGKYELSMLYTASNSELSVSVFTSNK